jgi:hypothetical protein
MGYGSTRFNLQSPTAACSASSSCSSAAAELLTAADCLHIRVVYPPMHPPSDCLPIRVVYPPVHPPSAPAPALAVAVQVAFERGEI